MSSQPPITVGTGSRMWERQTLHLVARFLLPAGPPSTWTLGSEHRCCGSCAGVGASHLSSPLSCQRWHGSCRTANLETLDLGMSFWPLLHIMLLLLQLMVITLKMQEKRKRKKMKEEMEEAEGGGRGGNLCWMLTIAQDWHSSLCRLSDFNIFKGFGGSDSIESACNAGDPRSIPGSGRSPGERNVNPFQYSCLENSMDRGVWWAAVHGIIKTFTWLTD